VLAIILRVETNLRPSTQELGINNKKPTKSQQQWSNQKSYPSNHQIKQICGKLQKILINPKLNKFLMNPNL
jgi:hypothetical protein